MDIIKKVNNFFWSMYLRILIPIINKSTSVGKCPAIAIDHIITDYVLTCDFKTAILKTDLTDHFPIVIVFLYNNSLKNYELSQQRWKSKDLCKFNLMKKISKLSITDYLQSIRIELKIPMIPMRLKSSFSIYLTKFRTYISQRF